MPYTIKKVGSTYKIYHKGSNRLAVKKGYRSESQAERVGGLRMLFAHRRK